MKKSIFTIEDIKEFLAQHNYLEWSGYILDYQNDDKVYATIDDFNNSQHSPVALEFITEDNVIVFVDMLINNFSFETFIEDLNISKNKSIIKIDRVMSQEWQAFLLKKYKNVYAEELFNWSVDNIHNIDCETNKKIERYSKQEKTKAQQQIEIFSESAKKAMQFLPENYFETELDLL